MPLEPFVRDSLVVAVIVVLMAGALALTADLVLGISSPFLTDAGPAVVVVLYLLAFGLGYLLWRSQPRGPQAGPHR